MARITIPARALIHGVLRFDRDDCDAVILTAAAEILGGRVKAGQGGFASGAVAGGMAATLRKVAAGIRAGDYPAEGS